MINDKEFDEIFNIMDKSFPDCEMRTYAGQRALCSNPYYRIIVKKDTGGSIIAFLAVWEFSLFSFVEHIAVDSVIRGGGIGGKLLFEYLEQCKKPIILEVEPSTNNITQSRVRFYNRLGFHLNDFYYLQPPYRQGYDYMELNIMSYPYSISETEFAPFKEIIYKEVYHTVVRNTVHDGQYS